MKRAARAAFDVIETRYAPEKIIVVCGSGNNAGDGYLVAVLAKLRGIVVTVLALKNPAELVGDARKAYQYASDEGVMVIGLNQTYDIRSHLTVDESYPALIVDALLGTGFSGPMRPDYLSVIEQINQSRLPVLALDLPSGVDGDTGHVEKQAVMAHSTVGFVGLKRGLLTGVAPNYVGKIIFF